MTSQDLQMYMVEFFMPTLWIQIACFIPAYMSDIHVSVLGCSEMKIIKDVLNSVWRVLFWFYNPYYCEWHQRELHLMIDLHKKEGGGGVCNDQC